MNTDKLAINWQNFARVQIKFAFIIRSSKFDEDDKSYEIVNADSFFESFLNNICEL